MDAPPPGATHAAEVRGAESNYPASVKYDADDSGVRVREEAHARPWEGPVTGGIAPTAGAEGQAPQVIAPAPPVAAAENTPPAVVGAPAPGKGGGFRATPTDTSAPGIEVVAKHPADRDPTATVTNPERVPTTTPGEVPDPTDTAERPVLSGMIPFDMTALESEAREFLGRVASLGGDWAGEAGWMELAWLSIGALLAGGVTHTTVVSRRRNRTAVTLLSHDPVPIRGEPV
jgi:hypothetical protein